MNLETISVVSIGTLRYIWFTGLPRNVFLLVQSSREKNLIMHGGQACRAFNCYYCFIDIFYYCIYSTRWLLEPSKKKVEHYKFKAHTRVYGLLNFTLPSTWYQQPKYCFQSGWYIWKHKLFAVSANKQCIYQKM